MRIQRMDNVGIVFEDMDAAIAVTETWLGSGGQSARRGPPDSNRLCYVRGPEGIIVGLSEQLS